MTVSPTARLMEALFTKSENQASAYGRWEANNFEVEVHAGASAIMAAQDCRLFIVQHECVSY